MILIVYVCECVCVLTGSLGLRLRLRLRLGNFGHGQVANDATKPTTDTRICSDNEMKRNETERNEMV